MRVPVRSEILSERLGEVRELGLADVYAARRPYEQLDVWHDIDLGGGWSDPGLAPPQWLCDPLGIVHIRGVVDGGAPKVGNLPLEMAPAQGSAFFPLYLVDPSTGVPSPYSWPPFGMLRVIRQVADVALSWAPTYYTDTRAYLSHSWLRAPL